MAAKDRYHAIVKGALARTGWTVSDDPLRLKAGEVDFKIDLGAERLLIAQRGVEKIAVEIKSFITLSPTFEFHLAVGQYINYRAALQEVEPERKLYLAVPLSLYENFFQRTFVQQQINNLQLKLIVYDPDTEELVVWIE